MNRQQLIDKANEAGIDAVRQTINFSVAKTLARTIRIAKRNMEFKAAEVLIKVAGDFGGLPKLGKSDEVDMKKYSVKIELTFSKGTKDFNSLVIGHCNQIGQLVGQSEQNGKEVYTFAFKPEDAKRLTAKLDKIQEVTLKRL